MSLQLDLTVLFVLFITVLGVWNYHKIPLSGVVLLETSKSVFGMALMVGKMLQNHSDE